MTEHSTSNIQQPTSKPVRIQLRRAKGWKMPQNTVKVDRSTRWGNPFVVGENKMTAAQCVEKFRLLCEGYLCISISGECAERQKAFIEHAKSHIKDLKGKNLACWCKPGKPCHADVLLEIANAEVE